MSGNRAKFRQEADAGAHTQEAFDAFLNSFPDQRQVGYKAQLQDISSTELQFRSYNIGRIVYTFGSVPPAADATYEPTPELQSFEISHQSVGKAENNLNKMRRQQLKSELYSKFDNLDESAPTVVDKAELEAFK